MVKLRRITLPDGTKRLEVIPETPEKIEERKKLHERSRKKQNKKRTEWLTKKIKENPKYRQEKNDIWAKKKGFKNYSEYESAIYHGFNDVLKYHSYLENIKRLKKEEADKEALIVSSLNNEMKGYLAGFFDAEGCIRTDKNRGRLYVIINQSYFPVLELINNMFKGSMTKLKLCRLPSCEGFRKQAWSWTLISEKAVPFLELICSYSIEKRKQIELALKYQKEIKINHKGGGCQVEITIEEHKQRCFVYNELRRLKNDSEICNYIPYIPKDILIGYFSGFFDVEGCLRIYKDNRSIVTYILFVSISNSNFNILKLYQDTFDGDIIRINTEKEHYKEAYQWRIVAQKALSFLKTVEQYSIVKKEQIKLAIEFKELQNSEFSYIGKSERSQRGDYYYNKIQELKKDTGEKKHTD